MTPRNPIFFGKKAHPALMTALAAGVAACVAGPYSSSPQQVGESKPDVTYSYRGDQELVEATRRAEDYCRTYNSWSRNAGISENTDGSKNVLFKCDRPIAVVAAAPLPAVYPPPRPVQPSVTYTYRSDQELVDATSSATSYCMQFSGRPRTVQVTPNVDGSRTVVFDCLRI